MEIHPFIIFQFLKNVLFTNQKEKRKGPENANCLSLLFFIQFVKFSSDYEIINNFVHLQESQKRRKKKFKFSKKSKIELSVQFLKLRKSLSFGL